MAKSGPVVLCILDGWGINPSREANAVALGATPNFDRIAREVVATLPKYTNSHLLQLTNQVGIGQAFKNSWFAARLVGFAIDFEDIGGVDIADDTEVSRAGHSHVLLRAPEGSARARVGCDAGDGD